MEKLNSILIKFNPPTADYPDGQFKDASGAGAGDGSEGIAQSANDWYYGLALGIKKYSPTGDLSDNPESVTDSDNLDSMETAIGIKNPNVLEWVNTTAYIIDDIAMYLGLQFVAMVASTGSIPMDNPDKWLPCFERNEAVMRWQKGDNISGGFDILHDYRDVGYRQLFGWGKYNLGGFAGRDFQATGVHLDGTVITGNATLEALFDVGGGNEYHLLDIIAPDVVGTRTLLDARGAAAAVVDAIAGNREDVGAAQDDAMQQVTGSFTVGLHKSATTSLVEFISGVFTKPAGSATLPYPDSVTNADLGRTTDFDNADSTSPNPAKTDPLETRMKNYSIGVPSILILQEI